MESQEWEELLVWRYTGPRFQEGGIDLRDLAALVGLRKLLSELARHVWKQRNPDRSRLSANAASDLQLRLFSFERGSCVARIYYAPPPTTRVQVAMFAEADEENDRRQLVYALPEAARWLSDALADLRDERNPTSFPDNLLPDLRDVLGSIEKDAVAELQIPQKNWPTVYEEVVPMAARNAGVVREVRVPSNDVSETIQNDGRVVRTVRLDSAFASQVFNVVAQKARVSRTVTGEVTMASLKGRAAIVVDGKDVRVTYPPELEKTITFALHQHDRQRIRVRGQGDVDLKTGRLLSLDVERGELLKRPPQDSPSIPTFERWAKEQPNALLDVIASGELRPTLLTFAAEIAGTHLPSSDVVPTLLNLLEHQDSSVREGAVYGLAKHAGQNIDAALRLLMTSDPSPGVREAAAAALEDR